MAWWGRLLPVCVVIWVLRRWPLELWAYGDEKWYAPWPDVLFLSEDSRKERDRVQRVRRLEAELLRLKAGLE